MPRSRLLQEREASPSEVWAEPVPTLLLGRPSPDCHCCALPQCHTKKCRSPLQQLPNPHSPFLLPPPNPALENVTEPR